MQHVKAELACTQKSLFVFITCQQQGWPLLCAVAALVPLGASKLLEEVGEIRKTPDYEPCAGSPVTSRLARGAAVTARVLSVKAEPQAGCPQFTGDEVRSSLLSCSECRTHSAVPPACLEQAQPWPRTALDDGNGGAD